MYKVKLHPDKCQKGIGGWLSKRNEGDIEEVSNVQYNWHKKCGCMEVLEHYKMVTVKKETCKCCGSILLHRKKIILEK